MPKQKAGKRLTQKQLIALSQSATSMSESIELCQTTGDEDLCENYTTKLWELLEENPKLKSAFPQFSKLITTIDEPTLLSLEKELVKLGF